MPEDTAKNDVSRKACPIGQRPMDLRVDLVYIIAATLSPRRYFSELKWEIKQKKRGGIPLFQNEQRYLGL